MHRIFIAADISDKARSRVAEHIRLLKSIGDFHGFKPVRPENLHLTLKFLGDTDDAALEKVQQAAALTASLSRAAAITIAGTGVFPAGRAGQTLWIGVDDATGKLAELAERLDANLANIGFPRERRRFSPHLTVGRIREGGRQIVVAHRDAQFRPEGFVVSEIVLYESKLLPTGPVYSKLDAFPLAG